MILLPAIDLMTAQVVRLRQGKASEKTVYSDDPVSFAKKWETEGGDYLHIVDLDAAFTGEQRNLDSVRQIARAIGIPCELGGGMRDEAAIERAFEAGVSRIVIGIATDGMMQGPNFGEIEKVLNTVRCQVVASGGVSKADDVIRLSQFESLYGVIIGKALYDKTIDLAELAASLTED
jgi:phosphoribosylformimino-5-aminoimidazole carboxamide ribotide isomerase